jgi:tetratricopeptide (TPR) repeat protein
MTRKLLCSMLLIAGATTLALADDKADKAKAKTLYEEGLKHYNVAEWQDAIKAWKESYLLSKRPLLLFNIGQAYRLSGDCKQAQTFYDSYVREEPSPKNQSELDEAIALCAKQGADKPVDKPVTPVLQKPDPSNATPTGPVVAQGGPAEPQPPERVDSGPQTTGGGMRKIGIGVGAAGVVMLGAGVFFGLGASSASSDLDGYMGEWGPDQQALEDKGKRYQSRAIILTTVGAAAAIAGGVMFAIGGPKQTESSTVTIVPTNGGAAIGWTGQF